MLHNKRYYIFIETPSGEMLRETGIIIRKDKNSTRYLEEEDVKSYLKAQFEGEKIEFFTSGPANRSATDQIPQNFNLKPR